MMKWREIEGMSRRTMQIRCSRCCSGHRRRKIHREIRRGWKEFLVGIVIRYWRIFSFRWSIDRERCCCCCCLWSDSRRRWIRWSCTCRRTETSTWTSFIFSIAVGLCRKFLFGHGVAIIFILVVFIFLFDSHRRCVRSSSRSRFRRNFERVHFARRHCGVRSSTLSIA